MKRIIAVGNFSIFAFDRDEPIEGVIGKCCILVLDTTAIEVILEFGSAIREELVLGVVLPRDAIMSYTSIEGVEGVASFRRGGELIEEVIPKFFRNYFICVA
jgi:hypothetical protein